MRGEEYARFTRIVFDTAPTGHTLRLLTVPDFVEASLGKLIRLRKKLAAAGGAVRGLFGASEKQDEAVAKLEALKVRRGGYGRHVAVPRKLACAAGLGPVKLHMMSYISEDCAMYLDMFKSNLCRTEYAVSKGQHRYMLAVRLLQEVPAAGAA